MFIKPHAGQPAKIKVVGVGGGGGNAVSSMVKDGGIKGVDFIAVNTDAQALLHNEAPIKLQIGETITKGLGSGGNPDVGKAAADESKEKIKAELEGSDMVFITAGEGGGTGTGAAPVIAEMSKEMGILTVAVVTRPFDFEGTKRRNNAEEGITQLKKHVDTLIIVPNQKVLQTVDRGTSMMEAFKRIDSVLYQGVKGIAELITTPGLVNVDFNDVKTVMKDSGTALMGLGYGKGENRAIQAIQQAIQSPLLDLNIDGAKGVLLNIIGGNDMSIAEIDEAVKLITNAVDPEAEIIWGAVIDENLKDEMRVTVIATRFDERMLKLKQKPLSVPAYSFENQEEATSTSQDEEPFIKPLPEPKDELEDEFDTPTFLRLKRKKEAK